MNRAVKRMIEELKNFKGPLESASIDELHEIVCAGCDFYSPEKERLQCGAFKILVELVKQGKITAEDLMELDR